MDRISLRQQRQRWQQKQKRPFELRQDGRFSEENPKSIKIEKYLGFNGSHSTENQIRLTPLNGGGVPAGDVVLVLDDRFLIGPSRGNEII